jgi:hypothetical protein
MRRGKSDITSVIDIAVSAITASPDAPFQQVLLTATGSVSSLCVRGINQAAQKPLNG